MQNFLDFYNELSFDRKKEKRTLYARKETDKTHEIQILVPGVKKSEVDIVIEPDHLIVNVNQQEDDKILFEPYDLTYTFYFDGNEVDLDKTTAKLERGILMISLPKVEREVKRIQIK